MIFSGNRGWHYLLLAVCTLGFSSHLQSKETDRDSITVFDITPKACIAQYKGEACELKVKVQWQSNRPQTLCFSQQNLKLTCWQEKTHGQAVLAVKLLETTEFTLVNSSNEVLAKQSITMNFAKKYRRRLKPKWSIF